MGGKLSVSKEENMKIKIEEVRAEPSDEKYNNLLVRSPESLKENWDRKTDNVPQKENREREADKKHLTLPSDPIKKPETQKENKDKEIDKKTETVLSEPIKKLPEPRNEKKDREVDIKHGAVPYILSSRYQNQEPQKINVDRETDKKYGTVPSDLRDSPNDPNQDKEPPKDSNQEKEPPKDPNQEKESPKPKKQNGDSEIDKKYRTVPSDPRYHNQNQTKWCYASFVDYTKCIRLLGEGCASCEQFKKVYKAICPNAWVKKWESQIQEGVFPANLPTKQNECEDFNQELSRKNKA